jgi:hypothetical protein
MGEDMVERVMLALSNAGLDSVTEDDARAAIEAMREPTDLMGNGLSKLPREPYKPGSHSATEIWRAMIDAALNQKGVEG